MKLQKSVPAFISLLLAPIVSLAQYELAAASFQYDDGVPIVNCAFNGDVASRACIIDTGSSGSHLPPELAHQAESYRMGEISRFLTASGTIRECVALHLDSVKIDQLSLNPMQVDKCTASPHGVIGIDAFSKKRWHFDFKNGFVRQGSQSRTYSDALMRDSSGYVYVPIQIGDLRTYALFDTGVSIGGAVDPNFLKANPRLFQFAGKVVAQDPSGASASYDTYKVTSLNLGNGRALDEVTFISMDQPAMWNVFRKAGAPIILGMDVLKHYSWFLDLENNLWSID